MTEPDVASSDASNVTTAIRRDGEHYVIDGRKWFITGAANPGCKVAIVMGKTDFTPLRTSNKACASCHWIRPACVSCAT